MKVDEAKSIITARGLKGTKGQTTPRRLRVEDFDSPRGEMFKEAATPRANRRIPLPQPEPPQLPLLPPEPPEQAEWPPKATIDSDEKPRGAVAAGGTIDGEGDHHPDSCEEAPEVAPEGK